MPDMRIQVNSPEASGKRQAEVIVLAVTAVRCSKQITQRMGILKGDGAVGQPDISFGGIRIVKALRVAARVVVMQQADIQREIFRDRVNVTGLEIHFHVG